MLKRTIFWGILVYIFSGSIWAESHHPEEFIQSIQNDPQAGKKIYQHFCATCHAKDPSIELGAPKIGVKNDWKLRMKKGLDRLLVVTKNGLNQMPPRGGCFECSDDLLKAAIVYMLPPIPKSVHKNK
jgi:cytochrome c5